MKVKDICQALWEELQYLFSLTPEDRMAQVLDNPEHTLTEEEIEIIAQEIYHNEDIWDGIKIRKQWQQFLIDAGKVKEVTPEEMKDRYVSSGKKYWFKKDRKFWE